MPFPVGNVAIKKEKKTKISSEELEDLHAEHSVKTASKQPGRYEGSPGAETSLVGQKKGKIHRLAKHKLHPMIWRSARERS